MSTPRLYVPQPLRAGCRLTVEGQPAHHVTRVLRLRTGTALRVFDGSGHEHDAVLSGIGRAWITLEIGAAIPGDRESSLQITLAQGIARHDRMDLILQKAVELGVQTIQPLWLQRSQTHLQGERMERRLRHWQGILTSACEQSGRNTLPKLLLPAGLPEWIGTLPPTGLKLLLRPDGSDTLNTLARPAGDILMLVGPEGGLDPGEQSLARSAGFTGVRLGPRILRTETAALAAIAGLQTKWGDFL
jgi:16S rRNA (uracil1498-N3)-methyltransferase